MDGLPGALGGKTCNHVEPGPAPHASFFWAAGHLRPPVNPLYSAVDDAAWPHKVHYVQFSATLLVTLAS